MKWRLKHQMKESTMTYKIGEFAKLAGVSVRTLHFYDEAGLLKPDRAPESQHRFYQQDDLLRLQQILTLKYLGFSLQEIESLLASPAYNVAQSLTIQKEALSQRILQLQDVVYALSRILELLSKDESPDWQHVIHIVQMLSETDKSDWLKRYYPPEYWDWLQARAVQFTPAQAEQAAQQWQAIYDGFRQHQELPADHPTLQALAAQMHQLGQAFTQGDPALEQALANLYSDPLQLPEAYRVYAEDSDLQTLMFLSLTLYRQQLSQGDQS